MSREGTLDAAPKLHLLALLSFFPCLVLGFGFVSFFLVSALSFVSFFLVSVLSFVFFLVDSLFCFALRVSFVRLVPGFRRSAPSHVDGLARVCGASGAGVLGGICRCMR
ncbi:putative transmembrane protein [Toxoplasma gondii VAND]|uniref:Putative transmembrane protein n=1 Tax=Toxoplasma gondii VAND TaxID=933077 RepID=A0A086PMC3_TOXGO|nr:putative transmembrane protein [Toxoplasma gondii VAND]